MNLTNSILNLPNDVEFSIRSTFFNELEGTLDSSLYTFTIPSGRYAYSEMVTILNNLMPLFTDFPYENTCYGIGGVPVPDPFNPNENPSVTKDPVNTKFIFSQDPFILTQVYPGNGPNVHQYRSFEIVNNEGVYRLFVMLGLVTNQNPSADYVQGSDFIIRVETTGNSYDPIANETTYIYSVNNSIFAQYSFDFSYPKNLYFYTDFPVKSSFRSPFDSYNPSNLLLTVPLTVNFGQQLSYNPQTVLWAQQKSVQMTQLVIRILDDFGKPVDFQGVPYSLTLSCKFGVDDNKPMISGTMGVPASIASTPSLHQSAEGFNNGADRDMLFSSQKNQEAKRKRIVGNGGSNFSGGGRF